MKTFKTLAAALVLAATAAVSFSAEAGMKSNGISINGIIINGIQINGLVLNGMQLNGLKQNGLFPNGFVVNGLFPNGFTINGTSATSIEAGTVVAVTLPE